MTIDAKGVNDAMVLVSTVFPQAMAAYNILKLIWLRTNPGKTEEDYFTYLGTESQKNIDDASAILLADGYMQDPNGRWVKPAAPPPSI